MLDNRAGFAWVDTAALAWRPSRVAAGVTVEDIATSDGWQRQIVCCAPGARFAAHTHQQPEFVFVLEGERVRAGRRLGPGWASV
jgi:uncharacterized RmlC-like cupin family protein